MLRRIVPATAAAALLLTGLSACTSAPSVQGDCTPTLRAGALSNGVVVLGSFGEAPQVDVPDGIEIVTSQATVLPSAEEPARDAVPAGSETLASVNMAIFDAETGAELYASPAFAGVGGPEFLVLTDEAVSPLSEAIRCALPGERVVLGLAPADAGMLSTQLGGTDGASLVGVIDVVSVAPLSAAERPGASAPRGLPARFPAVVTDETGRPGIVLPPNAAPSGTTVAVRIAGTEAEVEAEDSVVAHVLEVDWQGNEIANSWNTGPMGLGTEEQISQSGYAYRAALTGQRVGSQVVIIENTGDTVPTVRVVDILGVA